MAVQAVQAAELQAGNVVNGTVAGERTAGSSRRVRQVVAGRCEPQKPAERGAGETRTAAGTAETAGTQAVKISPGRKSSKSGGRRRQVQNQRTVAGNPGGGAVAKKTRQAVKAGNRQQ